MNSARKQVGIALYSFFILLATIWIDAFPVYKSPLRLKRSISGAERSRLKFLSSPKNLFSNAREKNSIELGTKSDSSHLEKKKIKRNKVQNIIWQYSSLPRRAVQIYTDYVKLLWFETSTDARQRIAKDKASETIRAVQHLGEEYVGFSEETSKAHTKLIEACELMLGEIKKAGFEDSKEVLHFSKETEKNVEVSLKKKKKRRSILFGVMMGSCVACWVFSGNWIFTGILTLMTILGQLEYYRMIISTGVYPARKISVVGASSMFLTALFAPNLHQICLPLFGLWAMVWFLTMKRKPTTIPEIATTFTGMFYLGYVPSFWVRLRLFGANNEATRMAPLVAPLLRFLGKKAENLPSFIPSAVHLPITEGAVFIFWAWLCIAFSDVGAYFAGRKYGKTKLGEIFPAAGATSPNKSLEGFFGGAIASASLGIMGAWVQKWPFWALTGALQGIILASLGLIGDLTASMLKRDAGLKDFGNIIPEHGGIMDRVDSFVWSAPYSWVVCVYILPALKSYIRARFAHAI